MAADPAEYAGAVAEALARRGRTVVRVQGRSMYPTLRNGMQIEVQPVAYDELAPGDLLVFTDGRALVCHRLLRKTARVCYCKGDTNLRADPPIPCAHVLGRVTRVADSPSHSRANLLDEPRQRRQAARLARFSYPCALYYNLLHFLGRCRWWARCHDAEE